MCLARRYTPEPNGSTTSALGVVVAETRDGAGAAQGGGFWEAITSLGFTMNSQTMDEVTRSADRMISSAKSGGFTVTKEAADPIIKVLEHFIDEIKIMDRKLVAFEQAPPLGGHDYGLLVAEHMQEAANDDRSPRAALQQLQIVLERSRDALRVASGQYQEQEESVRDSLRGMGSEEV